MDGKRIKKIILLLLSLLILTACGGDKPEEDDTVEEIDLTAVPNVYFIGSQSITAVQPEAGVFLSQLTTGENGCLVYTYEGFSAVGTSVQGYVTTMTGEEQGFSVVDRDTLKPVKLPNFATDMGTVSLSKPSENQKLTVVQLDWYGDRCIASISIEDAPPEEAAGEDGGKKPEGLSQEESIAYIKALAPSVLGLSGSTMDGYNVYIMNGFVYVDGQACLRLKIYSEDSFVHTHEYVGTYFMSAGGEHIYRLGEDGLVREMDQNP